MSHLNELVTTGYLAGELRQRVHEIMTASRELSITPAQIVDGVPHFTTADADRIARHLRLSGGPIGDRQNIH